MTVSRLLWHALPTMLDAYEYTDDCLTLLYYYRSAVLLIHIYTSDFVSS
jgi:hypothetical protein